MFPSLHPIYLCLHPAYARCRAECTHFSLPDSPVQDWMLMLHVSEARREDFSSQLRSLLDAWAVFCSDYPDAQPVFTRVLLSDAANQEALARALLPEDMGALSLIEQPPLDGTRVALWIYCQSGIVRQRGADGSLSYELGGVTHFWTASAREMQGDACQQCQRLFEDYSQQLESRGGTLYDHAVRTWLFVQNVDANYAGVVEGRNRHFDEKNLVVGEHFISSTGIQGRSERTESLVQLDAYSIIGLPPEDIQFLYAPTHLNPTHEYGVRFERGTTVRVGDRRYSYISGTASIDNKGDVVHVGEIIPQTQRMCENVAMLLAEVDADLSDIAQMFVYLRDIADYEIVRYMFDARFPDIPKVILLAPVCRPTWLIEMECIAIHR